MVDEEDPDLELIGTSPGVIAFFMILISLIVPIGIIPMNAFMVIGGSLGFGYPNFLIYSLVWCYAPEFPLSYGQIPLFMLVNIWLTLPLTIFNILYIRQIIRYYQGKCTRYSAVWVGMLSIVLPTLVALSTSGILVPNSEFIFIGPIPIQFVAGLYFLRKYPGPEMTSPWVGNLDDNSWWRPKKPQWWYRMFPPKGEEITEETENESPPEDDWLETE